MQEGPLILYAKDFMMFYQNMKHRLYWKVRGKYFQFSSVFT